MRGSPAGPGSSFSLNLQDCGGGAVGTKRTTLDQFATLVGIAASTCAYRADFKGNLERLNPETKAKSTADSIDRTDAQIAAELQVCLKHYDSISSSIRDQLQRIDRITGIYFAAAFGIIGFILKAPGDSKESVKYVLSDPFAMSLTLLVPILGLHAFVWALP
jgi:hypothetical protein